MEAEECYIIRTGDKDRPRGYSKNMIQLNKHTQIKRYFPHMFQKFPIKKTNWKYVFIFGRTHNNNY